MKFVKRTDLMRTLFYNTLCFMQKHYTNAKNKIKNRTLCMSDTFIYLCIIGAIRLIIFSPFVNFYTFYLSVSLEKSYLFCCSGQAYFKVYLASSTGLIAALNSCILHLNLSLFFKRIRTTFLSL